ncbi:MAG: replicative DNA helicase, partial [Flavobacteriales bacterium]|nr:replicative DNA helicase [Flavobacteriales bacterium]
LGALMLEKDALTTVIDILHPETFYKQHNQKIFKAIQMLFQNSEPIDILTVTNQLKKDGDLEIVGGPYYITQLTNRVASASNIEFHARIVLQKFIQRQMIRIASQTIQKSYDESTDVFDLLDFVEKELFTVAEGNIRKNYDEIKVVLNQAISNIEKARDQEGGISGIPSGFTELDRLTSGWQPSDLIICAARPGMGKTAFVLSMARNIAVQFKIPVAFFSLEMSSVQLVNRLIASETEISIEKLKKGNLDKNEWNQLNEKITALADAPIYIDDSPALSVFELRAKTRRLKSQHDIKFIIIDYLQLMTAGPNMKGNREQEISTISRNLKTIAKELNIPIMALSQLSRAVETRGGDKKPMLSDLRESGAIEQDADMVTFIYRPEYYGLDEDETGRYNLGMGEIIIAKHRNGGLGSVRLKFIATLAKFVDLEENIFDDSDDPFSDNLQTYTMGSSMNDDDDEFGE